MTEQLKPCPECGKLPLLHVIDRSWWQVWPLNGDIYILILCKDCGVSLKSKVGLSRNLNESVKGINATKDSAIKSWNWFIKDEDD